MRHVRWTRGWAFTPDCGGSMPVGGTAGVVQMNQSGFESRTRLLEAAQGLPTPRGL